MLQWLGAKAPSAQARTTVQHYLLGLERLEVLAKLRGKGIKTSARGTRQSDAARYIFIRRLAQSYQQTFGQQPKATRDGPWCALLGAVLSHVEGAHVDDAHPIWLRAREWAERQMDSMVAKMRRVLADPTANLDR